MLQVFTERRQQSAATAGPTQEVECSPIRFVVGIVHNSSELHATRQEIAGTHVAA